MVDRTNYPADKTPELACRQIFGRQRLSENLCLLMADSRMLAIDGIAMLGDTIASAKTTIRAIVGDDNKFGATDAERELSLTLVAAIWKPASTLQDHFSSRRAKMEEDPHKIREIRERTTLSSASSLCDRTPTCSSPIPQGAPPQAR